MLGAAPRRALLGVGTKDLLSTETLPFLAPSWANGQEALHTLDKRLRAVSWLLSTQHRRARSNLENQFGKVMSS